jgi:hypothetical protein
VRQLVADIMAQGHLSASDKHVTKGLLKRVAMITAEPTGAGTVVSGQEQAVELVWQVA